MSTHEVRGPLAGLARATYRRRRATLLAWLVGTIAVMVLGFGFAAEPDNDFSGGDSEASRAQVLLDEHFPGMTGESITLAVRAENGVDEPETRARVEAAVARLARVPNVGEVTSPYLAPHQISDDRRYAYATGPLDVPVDDMPRAEVAALLEDVRSSDGPLRIEFTGAAVDAAETPEGGPTEGIGILAAMVILIIAFGSLLAMGLPILTALFGIGTGLALISVLGHIFPSPGFTPIIAAMIGIGVGIDYALFIVTRYREALHDGANPEHAVVTAITTAGRAVLFAGTTVVIALMGLLVMRQPMTTAMAVAASTAVLMTMIASVTLLPALLGFIGGNIDRFRVPGLGRTRRPLAERWARTVQRRPLIAALGATAVLLTLAAPALGMRLAFADSSVQPRDHSGYAAHQIMTEGFGPGSAAPLVIVATDGDATALSQADGRTAGVASAQPPIQSRDGAASIVMAFPETGAMAPETADLVHTLRDEVIPAATSGTGLKVYVGGPNAGSIDFAQDVTDRLPWLIAVVVGLSLVLLVAMVRSVTIALQAAVMNMLSVAAAYGVLTAVVQWGWAGELLGFPAAMPVTTWVPLMMFPILFGLSMDYEVFLVSRIRELYERGIETREAVAQGLARTAKVITAAAAIMVMVFLSVLLGSDLQVKQMGLGLAVAIFVDATIVRMVLVPALMELCGKANWWLPGPLARILPKGLAAEPQPEEPRKVPTGS